MVEQKKCFAGASDCLYKKKRYLNTGSCSLGRFQGIVLDTETLKYELIKEVRGSVKSV